MKKTQNQNKFVRIITMPFKILGKARDLYVRSMTGCAGKVSYGNSTTVVGHFSPLPKSYSVGSSMSTESEDYRELIRAASANTLGNRIDIDLILQQQLRQSMAKMGAVTNGNLPKSSSVGMGRIDEEGPCEFGEENTDNVKADSFYPRSKSYAVSSRKFVL